jgi:hypothetical protein
MQSWASLLDEYLTVCKSDKHKNQSKDRVVPQVGRMINTVVAILPPPCLNRNRAQETSHSYHPGPQAHGPTCREVYPVLSSKAAQEAA